MEVITAPRYLRHRFFSPALLPDCCLGSTRSMLNQRPGSGRGRRCSLPSSFFWQRLNIFGMCKNERHPTPSSAFTGTLDERVFQSSCCSYLPRRASRWRSPFPLFCLVSIPKALESRWAETGCSGDNPFHHNQPGRSQGFYAVQNYFCQ